MKVFILLVCVATASGTLISTRKNSNTPDVKSLDLMFPDRWLEVPLDHFNLFDNRTWQMRYKVSEKYFKKGNPVFIEIGGEWTIHGKFFIDGQLAKLTKKHEGLLVETEHRYYGKSLPLGTWVQTFEHTPFLEWEAA